MDGKASPHPHLWNLLAFFTLTQEQFCLSDITAEKVDGHLADTRYVPERTAAFSKFESREYRHRQSNPYFYFSSSVALISGYQGASPGSPAPPLGAT